MSMFGDVGIETPPRYCKYDYVYIYMYCICTSYMIYLMIFFELQLTILFSMATLMQHYRL